MYLLDYLDSRTESGLISPSIMGVTDPVLVQLVEEFAELQQQKKQMEFTMNDNVPQVNLIDQEIEGAELHCVRIYPAAISQLKLTINNVNDRIATVEQELDRLPGTERELIGIQREFDLNNTVYTFLLERAQRLVLHVLPQTPEHRVIDEAVPQNSSRVKPKADKELSYSHAAGAHGTHGADCPHRPFKQ